MDFNGIWVAVVTTAGGVMVGVTTWLGTRASASSKVEEAEVVSRGEEWQRILTASQQYTDRIIADQGKEIDKHKGQIDQQGQQIECLQGKVQQLEDENELTKTKYWKAILYGRAWRLRHPESVALIDVPPEIEPDL